MSEDDYEKVKLVGGGSYGQVYKAKRKSDKKVCALKYISKKRSKKDVLDARNEIYILERLRHRHIVQLLGSFDTADHIVLVCEYAVTELFKAIKNEWKGKFTEEKARHISCQICSALFYLHANKVLHRDLKPQNILVTKDETIKLCDFGFARFMGDTYYARTIQGTLFYMAPELFSDKHVHYTQKADLWSLGCIIYELCVGRPAFLSKSIKQMCTMHKNVFIPKKLSEDLQNLLRKLLAYDPHHRIPWEYILKHRWFKGGIEVSEFDRALESPYTRQDIAAEKRKEFYETMKVRVRYKRIPRRKPLEEAQKKEGGQLEAKPGVEVPDGRDGSGGEGVREEGEDLEGAGVKTTDVIEYGFGGDDDDDDDGGENEDHVDSAGDGGPIDTVVIYVYDDDEEAETNSQGEDPETSGVTQDLESIRLTQDSETQESVTSNPT